MLIDTHCHLEKLLRKSRPEEILQRMEVVGVGRCIAVGTSAEDWPLYRKLAGQYPGQIDWTVGLHPCHVELGWEDQVAAIASYFATEPMPVAMGEMGLDYFHLPGYPDEAAEIKMRQQEAFRMQLSLAYQLECPVVIHSRDAIADCVQLIDQSGVDWRKVVFHCFTEGPDELQPILQRGGRASFTGIITYRSPTVDPIRDAALSQGLERLMLETDAPYLAPEPLRGKPNEPCHVAHVARYVSRMFGIAEAELAQATTANAMRFFGLQ